MHFTVAGQCIGNDNSVSALILKEQLEQPVVTKSRSQQEWLRTGQQACDKYVRIGRLLISLAVLLFRFTRGGGSLQFRVVLVFDKFCKNL